MPACPNVPTATTGTTEAAIMGTGVSMQSRDYASLPAPRGFGVEVRRLETGEEAAWDQFVAASGTFFHLSGWKKVIESTLGHQCIFLTARSGQRITGVFPISRV